MPDLTITIHAERLDLPLMTPAFLEAAIRDDRAEAMQLLGATIPAEWWPVSYHTQRRLEQVRRDPTFEPWLPRAMVLRRQQVMVGRIGFHTAPDPEYLRPLAPGGVEFGYTVFPEFRRQGYATEASQALMTWAQQQGATRFVLSISPQNQPSLRIAAHFGFVKIGSHMDEEDGPEDIYERRYAG